MANPAAKIDGLLRSYGSPMAGHGADFVAAWRRYGVDPFQLAAIAGAETTFGKAGTGRPSQGYGAFGMGPGRTYPSYREAILDAAHNLKTGYYSEGRKSFETITPKWVGHPSPGYVQTERAIYSKLGGAGALGKPQAGGSGVQGAPKPARAPTAPAAPGLPALPPVPNLILPVTKRSAYAPMLPPTQGVTPGTPPPAPGQTGAVSRFAQYKREQPQYVRQVAQLAKALTPPPPAVSAAPATPGGKAPGKGGAPPGAAAVKGGFVMPVATRLTSGSEFSVVDAEGAPSRSGTRYHSAKDWFAPAGARVVAPLAGKIVEVHQSSGNSGQVFGGTVKMQLPNGYVIVFRHVDPAGVRLGQRVKAGTPLAGVAHWTDGSPHTHVEIWKTLGGGYVHENMLDPVGFFSSLARRRKPYR